VALVRTEDGRVLLTRGPRSGGGSS